MATKGYDVAPGQRSMGKQAGDAEIGGQIKKDLPQSSVNGTDKVSVFCHNGVVVLAGVVRNGSQVGTEAVRIAGDRFRA
jgi:osmotically-inducible protein OsmY